MDLSIQPRRSCIVTKTRSRAPALMPRPLRHYVSAALCSERERGRRGNTAPLWRTLRTSEQKLNNNRQLIFLSRNINRLQLFPDPGSAILSIDLICI